MKYGGPDGELGASLRYISQRYSMPYREVSGLLTDIGSEAAKMFHYNPFKYLTLMMLNKNNEYIPIRIMTNALFYVKICSKNWEDYLHEQTRNGA